MTREELDEAAELRAEQLQAEQRRELARREADAARQKEQDDWDRVIKESLANAETDDDAMLRRAIELSEQESLSRPKTQEELDMEEAIRLSLMGNVSRNK